MRSFNLSPVGKTHRVQVEVSQRVLQPVEVFPDGDLRLQPRRKPQPVTKTTAEPFTTRATAVWSPCRCGRCG